MKLLFIAPILPYPVEDGDRQRAYHLLKELSRMHEVHFLGFIRSAAEHAHVAHLETICTSARVVMITRREIFANCLAAWFSRTPLNVAAFASRSMHAAVRRLIEEKGIEGIYAYRLRMAPYARRAKTAFRILDYTDAMTRHNQNRLEVEASWIQRLYLRHEVRRLRAYEPAVSYGFDASVISSDTDLELLRQLGAAETLSEVTNGVDTQAFEPVRALATGPAFVFVGNMGYYPNYLGLQDFCLRTWPRLREKIPDAQLNVVGRLPADFQNNPAWHQPGITFMGIVPELRTVFERSRIAIAPLQVASGRQFKVIEYFASALPVITTALVAENVMAQDNIHCLVADQPETFVASAVRLLEDQALAERLRTQARAFAVEKYDWHTAALRLKDILDGVANAQQ